MRILAWYTFIMMTLATLLNTKKMIGSNSLADRIANLIGFAFNVPTLIFVCKYLFL